MENTKATVGFAAAAMLVSCLPFSAVNGALGSAVLAARPAAGSALIPAVHRCLIVLLILISVSAVAAAALLATNSSRGETA
ncbi:hypothetical protein [Actinoplanes sp. N902-109]|uniref:hypothetical protein n=1 Tax=Actinoplanes sp. (strain N902-109) TaxID=649831 RepID=UPI0003294B95|nr:hypothetical protein [Actinoplanes sp. N902-109]AGL19119.1 hypothetical protein L083_5609 [Actinoplanes sp. N902-109]